MGQKGKEVVRLNLEELLEDLTRAYCDEWLSHYYYSLAGTLVAGLYSPELAKRLKEQSMSEYEHSQRIARRIVELGAEPPRDFAEVARRAAMPPFKMPQKPSDIPGLVNAVLEAERHAIGYYAQMVEKTRHHDPVTYVMVEDMLTDEVADEEWWENLLR